MPVPPLRAQDLVETLHGVRVADPFRWLEPSDAAEVRAWQEAWTAIAAERLGRLPQRSWLASRLEQLWRYDDLTPDSPCLRSERRWYATKRADQDKWALWQREEPDAEGRLVLDPNTWERTQTLGGSWSSPDGRYLAYGVARGGDENPVLRVLDLETGQHLPDRFRGWKQGTVSWRHDNSGFYYASKPLPGEVPGGEEHYWHRVWWHPLGTDGSQDVVVFEDPKVKEHYHGAQVSEDGQWLVLTRTRFQKSEIFLQDLWAGGEPVPVATGFDADYQAWVVGSRVLLLTDRDAPRYRVLSASVHAPGREHQVELIPEHPDDTLSGLAPVGGRLYVVYQHAAHTRIDVRELSGAFSHALPLPGIGTASVSGFWSKPEVRVSYQSFATPPCEYRYNPDTRQLDLVHRAPIALDVSRMVVEQVWYSSKDGTAVPMFLVHRDDVVQHGDNPVFLTGYGGFNVSRNPVFATTYALWVEAGGVLAMPNLRGGGEFGAAWHEAGMREGKQRVFDDFIAAAEWLIDKGWTRPSRLAIAGGSNGGLLVAAALVQRPDLFRAVLCQVPLADMLRFHLFGIANIWTPEYGSPDDPEMFPYLRAYSPYHNVPDGLDAPAVLVTASLNDARTDPAHARKMFARLVQATGRGPEDPRPILLKVLSDSGHHGGVTLDDQIAQTADHLAFVMDQVGMSAPA